MDLRTPTGGFDLGWCPHCQKNTRQTITKSGFVAETTCLECGQLLAKSKPIRRSPAESAISGIAKQKMPKFWMGDLIDYDGNIVRIIDIIDALKPGYYRTYTADPTQDYDYIVKVTQPSLTSRYRKGQHLQLGKTNLEKYNKLE